MMNAPTAPNHQPAFIRVLAHVVSYVFHPLFIATYVMAFLAYLHPYAFAGIRELKKTFMVISVFFNTAFIPLFAVFIMWRLKLIDSPYLRTQKERIIPYSVAMICYFWAWYVFRNQGVSDTVQSFLLGSFLAVCLAWIANIYTRISMHTTAAGGAVVFFLLQALYGPDPTGYYFAIVLFIAGLTGTARLIVSDHTPAQIYLGFLAGGLCQVVALYFV
jgi:hypothetical protein